MNFGFLKPALTKSMISVPKLKSVQVHSLPSLLRRKKKIKVRTDVWVMGELHRDGHII